MKFAVHQLNVSIFLLALIFPLQQFPALRDQAKDQSSVSIKDLRNSPTEIGIDSTALSLSAYAWRDFMPGAWPGDGSPLMVALKVTASDKKLLPTGVRMDRAWVLFGEQVWEISNLRGPAKVQLNNDDGWIGCSNVSVCEVSVRNGPKWGPGVYVDVVVRLTDSEGRHYFLQAPKQYVNATS